LPTAHQEPFSFLIHLLAPFIIAEAVCVRFVSLSLNVKNSTKQAQ